MSSFCLGCGNSMLEGQRFCEVCGRDSQADSSKALIDPAVAFGLPPETSGKAIFSLISGILFLILPFSIVAVVFGYLSLYDIRRSAGRFTGKGLAVAGIILGYVGVAVIVGLIGLGIYGWRSQRAIRADRMEAGETSVVPQSGRLTPRRSLTPRLIATPGTRVPFPIFPVYGASAATLLAAGKMGTSSRFKVAPPQRISAPLRNTNCWRIRQETAKQELQCFARTNPT